MKISEYDIARFWQRVKVEKYACWGFDGVLSDQGYAIFAFGGRNAKAYRVAYQLVKGDIPSGLVLDHLCRNRWCVRPSHLEAVTNAENILRGNGPPAINARKTVCKYGHAFVGDNVKVHYTEGRPYRQCRECINRQNREYMRKYHARKAI